MVTRASRRAVRARRRGSGGKPVHPLRQHERPALREPPKNSLALGQKTTSDAVAVCVSDPLVPVTVIVTDEAEGTLNEVTVSVEDVVAGLTENDPVTCAGRPLTLRLTGPENPLLGVIVTV